VERSEGDGFAERMKRARAAKRRRRQ